MIKLTFNFQGASSRGDQLTANAVIRFSALQINNFYELKAIAKAKQLSCVEIYVHGLVIWSPCSQFLLESGDVLISPVHGMALNAVRQSAAKETLRSGWISWDQLRALSAFEPSELRDKAVETSTGDAHELQSV